MSRRRYPRQSTRIEHVIDYDRAWTCTRQVRPEHDDAVRLARVTRAWDDGERAALVALLRTRPAKLTWADITAEVAARESAQAFWDEHHPAGLFDDDSTALAEAAQDIAAWRTEGLGFLTFRDPDYPAQLREIHEMPPVLFHHGKLRSDEVGVSVVGSRQASTRGLDIARSVAKSLAEREMTVIAGLAKGIDTAAHQAALDSGGRTVAVIGTGISQYYPAENKALQARISTEGLVLSQFWPTAPPTKHSFPMRNAVMSGFGRATIVVEAGEHSGARIQARKAVGHGRPVILTDLVVAENKWPSALLDQPGVHVAASTAEIMALVESITTAPKTVDDLLTAATKS
jgi:DNA processing protein